MTINLNVVPIEAVLLSVDYFESEYDLSLSLIYEGDNVNIEFPNKDIQDIFIKELNDFIKRVIIADKVRPIKEIIIGRALYGMVEEC